MKYLELLQIRCKKLVTWVDDLFGKYIPIDNQRFRFLLLLITVGCGVIVGKYTGIQFFHDYLNQGKYASKHLAFIIYAVPTLALLWYFRTRDKIQQIEEIHEQINKTLTQIQQNKIINAIKQLDSGSIIKENVSANILMKEFNTSPKFDNLIKGALLNTCNKFYRDINRMEDTLTTEERDKMQQFPDNEYYCRKKLIEDIVYCLDHKESESYKSNNSPSYRVHTIIFRFLLLVIVGCAGGLLLGMVLNVNFLFDSFTQDMEIAKLLINVIIGAPMFAILWNFRTFDARKQIDKMQEQVSLPQENIWQDRFNIAIEDLGSNDITREEIGAQSLTILREKGIKFSDLIAIAFESAIDEFQRVLSLSSQKEVKYYNYEKAKIADNYIELPRMGKDEYYFLVNKLGSEGFTIYNARDRNILMMYRWLRYHAYKKSENDNTTKN